MAAHQFHAVAGTIQKLGEQPEQGLVGGGVHRRRGDFDAQFVAQRLADLIGGGARLQLHGQQYAFRVRLEERG